jgi:hypothetical protein
VVVAKAGIRDAECSDNILAPNAAPDRAAMLSPSPCAAPGKETALSPGTISAAAGRLALVQRFGEVDVPPPAKAAKRWSSRIEDFSRNFLRAHMGEEQGKVNTLQSIGGKPQ